MTKKKGRRAYLNNFEKKADGNYEYRGDYYSLSGGEKETRGQLRCLLAGGIAILALILIEGCFPVPGLSRSAYVLIPYVVQLAGAAGVCAAVVRLFAAEYPLREYLYETTIQKLPFRSGIAGVFGGMTLLGETVFLICNGSDGQVKMIVLFYIVQMAVLAAIIVFRRKTAGMEWEKKKGLAGKKKK